MFEQRAAEGQNYDVTVSERSGRFYLRIPELSLIADGPDLLNAHANLEKARRQLFEQHAALGLPLPPPRDVQVRRQWLDGVMPFAFKVGIATLAAGLLVITVAVTTTYVLRDPVRNAAQRMSRAALAQVTAGMEDFARRDLSPDREERLRAALRGIVPVLRPFMEELQPLFPRDTGNRPG